jgi:membrane protease YdiL (CAAX protease family)
MGESEVCPKCGWSYAPDDGDATESEPKPKAAPEESEPTEALPTPENAGGAPETISRAGWGEVVAVLAVVVVPNLLATVTSLCGVIVTWPSYWLEALNETVLCGCTIFVTLYLIGRSGETWERFGVTRPRISDFLIGFGMMVVAECGWRVLCVFLPDTGGHQNVIRPARSDTEYAMMVLMYAAVGYSEELVTRAYLITRLTVLLHSPHRAVVASALIFASMHIYQSVPGVLNSLVIGITFGVVFLMIRRVWPLAIGHALYDINVDLLTA